jgi:predicted phosphoadenosine phosphosulfate sulfurtransferase
MLHPSVIPRWYQIPLRMTNATSCRELWLRAWEPGAKWMRPLSPLAIHEAPGAPDRFYDFFPWYEQQAAIPTAHLVGLRSRESFSRWRATARNHGIDGVAWSSRTKKEGSIRFYPLFDWATGDVWKYLSDHGIVYNKIYDKLYLAGVPERQMRVSYLLHEQSFRALARIQELEPETYQKLLERAAGTHAAALYSAEPQIYAARKLPAVFRTWREYRDHLLATTPIETSGRFTKRFAAQGDDEATCKEHVRQILTHDWENNVPVIRKAAAKLREQWWGRL